ncbi:unnamed protein product [Adineta steineri]|uniref:Fibronectin type-III domain-containing protein n=1 Tax=Adineta steineri TaxID=433720 RepID=A0A819UGW7_9BILA|nr:unnamed protein product [Adineta steineri]CAF4088501.1 unnamed protein product [Adineta steineri]
MVWLKDGSPCQTSIDAKRCKLKIEKSRRGDTGKYELILKNAKREVKIPIDTTVLDRPGKSEGPMKVSDVTKEIAVVSWKSPLDNGGSNIERYIVEKQDVERGTWVPASEVNGDNTLLRVTKLITRKEYLVRVRAVNKEVELLETSGTTLAKNPYDEPNAPGKPEISDWDNDRVDLEWQASDKDVGVPVEKYIIEHQEKGRDQWVQVSPYMSVDNNVRITDLPENGEVEFRVKADNKAGESESNSSTDRVKITEYQNGRTPTFVKKLTDTSALLNSEATFITEFDVNAVSEVK